jgi:hypothetical protein
MFLVKVLKVSFAAAVIGGAALASSLPAAAGESTGTWRNGMVEGPYGPGYYGPGPGGGPRGHAYGYYRHHDHGWDGGGDCRTVRRRFVNSWGDVVIRREEVCD